MHTSQTARCSHLGTRRSVGHFQEMAPTFMISGITDNYTTILQDAIANKTLQITAKKVQWVLPTKHYKRSPHGPLTVGHAWLAERESCCTSGHLLATLCKTRRLRSDEGKCWWCSQWVFLDKTASQQSSWPNQQQSDKSKKTEKQNRDEAESSSFLHLP